MKKILGDGQMEKRNLISEVMPLRKKKCAFTLSEGATHVGKSDGKRKSAFTLAEVLITLGIVGIVAALTIPNVMTKITQSVRDKQKTVIERKLNQATETMQANGSLVKSYSSTAEFIDELSKSLKIISVCDSSNLKDCWGYENVTLRKYGKVLGDGSRQKSFGVSQVGEDGNDVFKNYNGHHAETMGIVLSDGTPMLLSWNRDCKALDPESRYQEGKTSECIAGIYDLNGKAGPNKYGEDVIPFNAKGFGLSACMLELSGGQCITSKAFRPAQGLSYQECLSVKDSIGLNSCWSGGNDIYAATVLECGHINNMPSMAQLKEMAPEMYLKNGKRVSSVNYNDTLTYSPTDDMSKVWGSWWNPSMIYSSPLYCIWSNEYSSNSRDASDTNFGNGGFTSHGAGRSTNCGGICVGN